jgi:anti-sigma B factor antagonist
MTTPLTLTQVRQPDGKPRLTAAGEIDMSNANALDEALAATEGPVTVDLTAVEYIDSAGLTVLFTHADRTELIVPELLAPLVSISGLAELTTVHRASP